MIRPISAFVFVSSTAFLAAACVASSPGIGTNRPARHDSIVVEVTNDHFLDATVYFRFEAGPLTRMGLVNGQTRDTFSIRYQPRRFIFTIDLVGNGEFITDPPITAYPNDEFELRLPSNLDRGAGGFRRVR
jgi:hypothetical protein